MGLFVFGILLSGVVIFIVLTATEIKSGFLPEPTGTALTEQFPHLIALEADSVAVATSTPVLQAMPTEVFVTAVALSPSATALALKNGQQSEIIGYSVEGRPLEVYTFGNGEQQRMIVAGIHGGDEWNTINLANQMVTHLNQNPHSVPEDVTLYILPNLNPDGEARAHNKYGRLNHNGVDLNRNFPVNWKMDWDRAGCWNYLPTSGGTGPGSESETQALMSFLTSHHVQALISYHSAALGIFPGGWPWEESSTRLAESIAEVTSYPFPPVDTGCTYSGTLADYAVSTGAAAVDLELTDHFSTDFDENLQALNVLLNFIP